MRNYMVVIKLYIIAAAGFLLCLLGGLFGLSGAGEVPLDPIMYAMAEPPENPSVDDIVKKWWCIYHTQQADSYVYRKVAYKGVYYDSYTTRMNRKGQRRSGSGERAIINLHGKNGMDFKDHIIYQSPEDIKGLAVLIWSYIDKEREQDTWLWLPSLRKIRRVPGSQKEDFWIGSDMSFADLSLRVPSDEKHKLIDVIKVDENFVKMVKEKGGIPRVLNWWRDTDTIWGQELWVIENTQLKGYITYEKRIQYMIKTGKEKYNDILNLFYDAKGRHVKTWDTYWQEDVDHPGWYAEGLRHLTNPVTGHHSFFDVLPPLFNLPIPEIENSQEVLPKEKTYITPDYIKEHLGKDYDTFVPWEKYGWPWESGEK